MIKQKGNRFRLFTADGSRPLGPWTTQEKAQAQDELTAISREVSGLTQDFERQQAAISMDEPYCGKTFRAGEHLYVYISKQQAERLRKSPGLLTPVEVALLDETQRVAGVHVI